jgi:hypothetical protein
VRVLSRLFRRRFLEQLQAAHRAGRLQCLGQLAELTNATAFAEWLRPLGRVEWVVYAKRPFAGPEAVLAYLSRYTHRVAIANSRLIACDQHGVTFRWKDYRIQGRERYKTMTLATDEFIRRFLLHVLPSGFHRIRHYGLFANPVRAENVRRARDLLAAEIAEPVAEDAPTAATTNTASTPYICPSCGAPMIVIETFDRGQQPRAPPGSLRS